MIYPVSPQTIYCAANIYKVNVSKTFLNEHSPSSVVLLHTSSIVLFMGQQLPVCLEVPVRIHDTNHASVAVTSSSRDAHIACFILQLRVSFSFYGILPTELPPLNRMTIRGLKLQPKPHLGVSLCIQSVFVRYLQ